MIDLQKWGNLDETKRRNEEEVCTPPKKTCGRHVAKNESLVLANDDSKEVLPRECIEYVNEIQSPEN